MATPAQTRSTPKAPALVMGLGFGGFIDGILLHQILQWHHMLTATEGHPMTTVAGLEANTLVDGLFHVATWILVAVGSWLMLRAWQERRLAPPWRAHLGLCSPAGASSTSSRASSTTRSSGSTTSA